MNEPRQILVDQSVYDLAAHWLKDDEQISRPAHDTRVMSLACDIQQAIEGWLEDQEREREERQKGDDDGVEYGDPREALDERARD